MILFGGVMLDEDIRSKRLGQGKYDMIVEIKRGKVGRILNT